MARSTTPCRRWQGEKGSQNNTQETAMAVLTLAEWESTRPLSTAVAMVGSMVVVRGKPLPHVVSAKLGTLTRGRRWLVLKRGCCQRARASPQPSGSQCEAEASVAEPGTSSDGDDIRRGEAVMSA